MTTNPEHPWFDTTLPRSERIAALVDAMTIDEKASQMLHQASGIERLGVPEYNWWNECLHGVARAGKATVFPQAIAWGASFDRSLVRRMADQVVPMTATLVVEVDPEGNGSRLMVRNHTVIKRGTWHVPVFRTLMSLTGGVKMGIRAYVEQLVGGDAVRLCWE